jgi:tRNA G18 (ribose-2'-O)-methylase SpoU
MPDRRAEARLLKPGLPKRGSLSEGSSSEAMVMPDAEPVASSQLPATRFGIKLLLWGVQSPVNTGMLLRVAETYRVPVGIIGSEKLLADASAMSTVSDFACGALERVGLMRLDSPVDADAWRGHGRLLATSIDAGAEPLSGFRFQPADVVVLGNEYDGLPDEVMARADCRITVPMADVWTPKPRARRPIDPSRSAPVRQDGRPSLNVAMTGAIICYTAFVQPATMTPAAAESLP